MSLSIGIVGLPNVGKSTLFNAITNSNIDAQNYPFCTIEPNTGIVSVPDPRLEKLSKISGTEKIIYSTVKFVDIAGLVKGASKGDGLGNKFLSNIRETSVIAHVIRCFEDENITHVNGTIDPISDIETINLELILADLEFAQKCLETQSRKSKSHEKEEIKKMKFLQKTKTYLENEKPIRSLELSKEETILLKTYPFLTAKKVIYVANISEDMLNQENEIITKIQTHLANTGDKLLTLCTKLESEIALLDAEEKEEYLKSFEIEESGLNKLSKKCFDLLGLQTYLTTGEKETRSWTIHKGSTAPQAAGVIHTDFEKGFIRANIIKYEDFLSCNGWKHAKEKGLLKQEGKEYIMREGDVVEFLFNV
jgi:ribosome-binding ATPase